MFHLFCVSIVSVHRVSYLLTKNDNNQRYIKKYVKMIQCMDVYMKDNEIDLFIKKLSYQISVLWILKMWVETLFY